MQTITEKLMDNRKAIASAVGKTIMDNKRASLGAAIGLGALVLAGAAYVGYLVVSNILEKDVEIPKLAKAKAVAEKATAKATGKKAKSSRLSKKVATSSVPAKGQDHHFIPNAAKADSHLNPKATTAVKHTSKEAAMRNENQKVKAATGSQKRKVLRIPGK